MYDPHAAIKTQDGAILEHLSSIALLPDHLKIELEEFLADHYSPHFVEVLDQFRLMAYSDLQSFEEYQCRMAEEEYEQVQCGLALPPSRTIFDHPEYPPHVV